MDKIVKKATERTFGPMMNATSSRYYYNSIYLTEETNVQKIEEKRYLISRGPICAIFNLETKTLERLFKD